MTPEQKETVKNCTCKKDFHTNADTCCYCPLLSGHGKAKAVFAWDWEKECPKWLNRK